MASSSKKKRSTAKTWKKASVGEDLTLPSGNVALVRRIPLEQLIAQDLVPDSLLSIAQEGIDKGKKGLAAEVQAKEINTEILKDKKQIGAVLITMDRCAALAIIEPKVLHHRRAVDPEADEVEWVEMTDPEKAALLEAKGLTEDDIMWADDVDFTDKSFIFQFTVGGTRDLERFREETGLALADVPAGEDLEDPSV